MTNSFKVIILLLTFNSVIMAKDKKEKGFEVSREISINVSSEKLWEIIGPGFEDAFLWSSTVDHSVGKGQAEFEGATCSDRVCDLNAKGFDKISEKLIKYSDQDMNLAYEVYEGMPSFITTAKNDWTVVEIDANHSKLVMNAEFKVKGLMGTLMKGMMKRKMEKLLDVVLNDAKVYAETGSQSEIKKERVDKLAKKSKLAA